MTDNFTLYLMLVAALAIGFLLGRQEWRRRRETAGKPASSYLSAFDQLVNDRQTLDIDVFVETVVSRNDSVETRLALGALVRRRGEVDKAIRIHQGLLARPVLTQEQRSQTELELARDYMAAGLLGRAENLLLELARRGGLERPTAQRALLEIYQREREWRQAVAVGQEIARQDRSVRTQLAHFQCELAEVALEQGDLRLARQELAKGSHFDAGCARVSLTAARVELAGRRYRDARRLLERAVSLDADCVPLVVEPYAQACRGMDDEAGYVAFLRHCLRLGPYLAAVQELAVHLERTSDTTTASEFVMEQLLRNPTLGGFVALLEHLDRDGQALAPEQLALVHRFSKSLLSRQPVYRCRNCGFPSRSLMWQCPSCHEWGTCKPISRNEQER
jgi:lipopolysaccharide biosynthesis regulator YciM